MHLRRFAARGILPWAAGLVGLILLADTVHAAPVANPQKDPMDWPNWRGPEQDRISRETGLIEKWNPDTKENVLWKRPEAAGISSPIVMNGKVYTQVRYKPDSKEEQEEVICLDADTGKILWENRWNVYLSDVPAERIGWSSVVGDPKTGRVYSLGVNGNFSCIDGETGKTVWSRSLGEQFGMISPYGGRTHPPTLFDDLVIINDGRLGRYRGARTSDFGAR
jgi:outer membrane protein assembly factor BamB